MGRGYNGDCRDCSYYRDNFHRSIYQDGYKCDYSGEYFDDQYGEQCHCFCDLAEVRAAEERRRIKDEEFKAALYGYMLSDDDNEVVDDETKPRRQRIEDGNASGFSNFLFGFFLIICIIMMFISCNIENIGKILNSLPK